MGKCCITSMSLVMDIMGKCLHYFNEFGGYLGQMCTNGIVGRSCGRAACVFVILQPVHCVIASY